MEAVKDSGIDLIGRSEPSYDFGIVFGASNNGIEKLRESISKIDDGKVRRLGSTAVIQTMTSGVSAYLSGMTAAGNCVTTNSLACATGTEAVSTILQLFHGFIFPNINCDDLHQDIAQIVASEKIPTKLISKNIEIAAKASFGFGDVNACIIFKKLLIV